MGAQLGCRHCEGCSATFAKDRCATVCLDTKVAVSSMQHAVGCGGIGGTGPDECSSCRGLAGALGGGEVDMASAYGVAGTNANDAVAIDLAAGLGPIAPCYTTVMEEVQGFGLSAARNTLAEQDAASCPNVGERRPLSELEFEHRFNAGKVKKIQSLAEHYSHWRPIRGDGNCYYRSVVFGVLERLLPPSGTATCVEADGSETATAAATGGVVASDANGANDGGAGGCGRKVAASTGRLSALAAVFGEVKYESEPEAQAHQRVLDALASWTRLQDLEQAVVGDPDLDEALIRAARRLVRRFIVGRAKEALPCGLTYGEVVAALDPAHATVEDFCAGVVDPMGRDAETLAIEALPRQLGVGVRVWFLDRSDAVDLFSLDTPGSDGKVDVHILFQPGHYDLLYLREQP
eukprot:TRINITY_DN31880_c0_g1_i1.p1 TRINITY_DN31880_c0_g1~~TRINITY_DN31880_c0_g1_i1.p1  ORF type:complete len:406 (-),score=83.15 TRINITY_DN31880_c0_g1_i1:101-1318(-)